MRRDRHHARMRQLAPCAFGRSHRLPACLKPASWALPHTHELSLCSARAGNAIHHAARPSAMRQPDLRPRAGTRCVCLTRPRGDPAAYLPCLPTVPVCLPCPHARPPVGSSTGTALMSPCSVRARRRRGIRHAASPQRGDLKTQDPCAVAVEVAHTVSR
jgi:hypothetical protein